MKGINIFLNAKFDEKGMEDAMRALKRDGEEKVKKWKVTKTNLAISYSLFQFYLMFTAYGA